MKVDECVIAVNDELASSPGFKAATAYEKQATYDSLVFALAVLVTYDEIGKRDRATHDAGVALANNIARSLAGEPKVTR